MNYLHEHKPLPIVHNHLTPRRVPSSTSTLPFNFIIWHSVTPWVSKLKLTFLLIVYSINELWCHRGCRGSMVMLSWQYYARTCSKMLWLDEFRRPYILGSWISRMVTGINDFILWLFSLWGFILVCSDDTMCSHYHSNKCCRNSTFSRDLSISFF